MAILLMAVSCKRCIVCETKDQNNQTIMEVEMCASGKGAAQKIKDFEKEIKEGNPNAVCKEKYW